jgi:hypothetical protein
MFIDNFPIDSFPAPDLINVNIRYALILSAIITLIKSHQLIVSGFCDSKFFTRLIILPDSRL